MPLSPDRGQSALRRLRLAVAALIAAGYGLTLAIFYPGIMTYARNSSTRTSPRVFWATGNPLS